MNDPVRPVAHDEPIILNAAKNEWASFAVQISGMPPSSGKKIWSMRLKNLQLEGAEGSIAGENYSAYQILPMPIDVNRAGYVRHTGLDVSRRDLPRALLPMPMDKGGSINLAALRDPARPADSQARADGENADPLLLWIDLHIPPETPAGEYAATIHLLESGQKQPFAAVPLKLTVHDFVLPDERHLLMVSQLDWNSLARLYPNEFEAVTPRLINRQDERYGSAVRTLDRLVALGQLHRTQVVIPRLQPIVKWPAAAPPQVDWEYFDGLVSPWLKGDVFPDRIPLGYWPMPAPDLLDRYDLKSRREYWLAAATHFDQMEWLAQSPVFLEKYTPGRASAADSIQMSAEASQILSVHRGLGVTIPLEDDQVQLSGSNNPNLIDPGDTSRLLTASPGLVFAPPIQPWPLDARRPRRWLRTDLPGLIPYVGAGGDERDVRLWAWLAFLRQADLILWNGALPRQDNPAQPADPNELVWFYPGSWFGVDEPVPTVQLKWLRQAQQDYEYLWLAKERGEVINALVMARLITKPVEIQPYQSPDPTYALMSGTTDQQAWDEAKRLLARTILLRRPGESADSSQRRELNQQTLQWIQPQERPLLMGRSSQWLWTNPDDAMGNWVDLRLGIDIYNASDSTPDQNQLQWTSAGPAWEIQPQPMAVPALATYHVRRFMTDARVNLDEVTPETRRPLELTFTDGFTRQERKVKMILPVAISERREGRLAIDGSLNDWDSADAVQDGPLVKMYDRPTLQRQDVQYASTSSSIYTAWADQNFYVAFKLSGLEMSEVRSARNFLDYQFRRAWGEDLCQILIQPIYADNTIGPVLHVVCKPNGGQWVERKLDPKLHADPWQILEATGIRYAAELDQSDWRGEVAIPWKAVYDSDKGMPTLLRFNFMQHRTATGESASWAGPLDFGRDDGFMGLIYLKELANPGMGANPR